MVLESTTGLDMGCPGSPPGFAMALRRALGKAEARIRAEVGVDVSLARREAPDGFWALMSFLDDVVAILPRARAAEMLPIIVYELEQLGLQIHLLKCKTWAAEGGPPAEIVARVS